MKITFLEHIKESLKKAKDDTTNKISALATKTVEAIEEVENQKANTSHKHSAGDITSGTLPVSRGGTGQTTAQGIRNTLGLGNTTGAVPVANGGTGATTAANARTNLGITPANIGAAASSHGTHVTFTTTAPVMDGTASVGTATTVSRSDHKHPTDTSRAAASHTHNYAGSSSVGGAATSAVKLQTARTIRTNLASTSTASFDGTANVTPGVTGTLPIANGGTGNTTGKAATATKLATARTIDGMNFDGSANIVHFGVCSTAADVAAKTVSLSGFILAEGARVTVYFANANTAGSPTLNVNSTGAHYLACRNGSYAVNGQWGSGDIVEFVYYSNHWIMLTANARRLTTARSIRINLGSTSASNFDGTANITPGVTGTLPIANGGTGSATVAGARNNLGLGNTSGALPIANGGTGATSSSTALSNLGGFPKTGGTISGDVTVTGNVRLKGSGNYGNKLNFGDSEYVCISEPTDDNMEIKAKNITIYGSGSDGVTVNNLRLSGTFRSIDCIADGVRSHAEGSGCIAKGSCSHAEGNSCIAKGSCSHAEGIYTEAKGNYSHTSGNHTIAYEDEDFVMGRFNKHVQPTSLSSYSYLTIGNGAVEARSNCFRVTHGNGIFANAAYKTTGADYAEYFEWKDNNPNNEDRVGLFVTLVGERIRIAKPTDKHILGIVSACPSILGDVYDDQWKGMYEIDIYGRPILEEVEVPAETIEIPDPENPEQTTTQVIREAHKEIRQKLNPDYDPTQEYIPRSERPEWDAVGMLGKLVAIDDGTCEADGYCTVGKGGIATKSEQETKFYVMARLDENHIKVMLW